MQPICAIVAGCVASVALSLHASTAVDYVRDIKPLLASKCAACHGALQQKSGMRLDAGRLIHKGSENGAVIVRGNSSASELLQRVSTADESLRMPPEGDGERLSNAQIELVKDWIDQGANFPQDEPVPAGPSSHWSYQSLQRPEIPVGDRSDWRGNQIDAFIAHEHRRRGLAPRPPASPETWLRRVYLDLIGLPPTRRELADFLRDTSESSFEKIVDKLLERPQYGQRWGRHWMDIWRYSDWYGSRAINEIRYSQRHIWRWRDWIVESLNEDRPYSEMLLQMLAGDELAPTDTDVHRATGFLGRNWYKFDRNVWMFETVEQTSQAFLGLTLRCARCHDHKFDPISQEDYYRFRAFFEPHDVRTDALEPNPGTEKDATLGMVLTDGVARIFDKDLSAQTFVFARGDNRYPDTTRVMSPSVPKSLGGGEMQIASVHLPIEAYYPALRQRLIDELLSSADQNLDAAIDHERQTLADFQMTDGQLTSAVANQAAVHDPKSLAVIDGLQQALDTVVAQLTLANKKAQTARWERTAIYARVAADRAKYLGGSKELALETARNAWLAERHLANSRAEQGIFEAEQSLASARASLTASTDSINPKTTPGTNSNATGNQALRQAEKRLADARSSLASARKAFDATEKKYSPLGEAYPTTSSGRRLALARWIVRPDNVRTSRVAVNHIWLRHFGQALVPTVANFGLNGAPPSHPELLDWLACELVEHDWRMKPIHRLIVLSMTYRQSSAVGEDDRSMKIDPENRFLWRMNSHRLEAEVVRDSVLYCAGKLDLALGGPEIPEKEGERSLRRSLYFRNTPNEKMRFLELFDVANPNECYRRKESVMPQQALALMNSGLALDAARHLTSALCGSITTSEMNLARDQFITSAFETILNRSPSPSEKNAGLQFLKESLILATQADDGKFAKGGTATRQPSAQPEIRARENLVLVLFNHNDFVSVR